LSHTLNGGPQAFGDQRIGCGALRYWAAWYGIRYGSQIQLPVPTPCVLQFIVDHADRSTEKGLVSELPSQIDRVLVEAGYKGKLGALAHNTLVHRIAVLSKAHQLRELKNPSHDPKVRELLSRTRLAYAKRGALPQKKDALTKRIRCRRFWPLATLRCVACATAPCSSSPGPVADVAAPRRPGRICSS
jgi:hypothetical protein